MPSSIPDDTPVLSARSTGPATFIACICISGLAHAQVPPPLCELTNTDFTEQTLNVGGGPRGVVIADVNNDTFNDLVVANQFSTDASVLLGNGDGTFQSPQNFTAGDPEALAIGDVNGDTFADLVIANEFDNSVSVLLGNGDGTFQNDTRYTVGTRVRSVAVGDVNGDTNLDIAAGNWSDGDASILLGNGDGTFQPEQQFNTGGGPLGVMLVDVNADTMLDLVTAVEFLDSVAVLLGNGDGTFQASVRFSSGDSPRSVAVADLNGDGSLDLAVASAFTDDARVLLGNGDGTFQAETGFPAGDSPVAIVAADLDGDANPDIAVTNQPQNEVTVLFGLGDGTFLPPRSFSVGLAPRAIAFGDVNGDGRNDLATANGDSANASVLTNTPSSTLAVFTGTAGGSTLFTDAGNWADGGVPMLTDPSVARFDATQATLAPIETLGLTGPVDFRALAHASSEIRVNLNGQALGLIGFESFDGPIGLELGVVQCEGVDPFPLSPPVFRFFNQSFFRGFVTTPRATVGVGGPAVLEIQDNTTVTTSEELVVGGMGDGTVSLSDDDARLQYGVIDMGPPVPASSVVIGGQATGLIDASPDEAGELSGGEIEGAAMSLVLGDEPTGNGAIRIDGPDASWIHTGDELIVGRRGQGKISVLNGAEFVSLIDQRAVLADDSLGTAEVEIRGTGSVWTNFGIGTLTVGGQGFASLEVEDGGALQILSGVTNASKGSISGDGMIMSDLVNFGEVRVGASASARAGVASSLTVVGDYDQFDQPGNPQVSGRLRVDLFDNGGVVSADSLSVTGVSSLAGGLIIESDSMLDPSAAATVDILAAGTVTGRFDVAFFPAVMPDVTTGEGRFLRLNYPSPTRSGPGTSVTVEVATLSDIIDIDPDASFDAGGTATFAASGDFDGDGDADLALAIPDANDPTGTSGVVTVLTNGTIEGSPTLFIPASTVSYSVGRNPSGLVVGEFDGVAGMDIAVCNEDSDDVNVLTNNGTGLFAVSAPIAVGNRPRAIASSDFDGNGQADLVVVNSGDNDATVLLNNSTPLTRTLMFSAIAPDLPTGPEPSSIDPLDVDNGKDEDDIVIANASGGTVTIFKNSGMNDGTFLPPMTLIVGDEPRRVLARDLDNDGFPEIVTANEEGDSLSILVNNGDGTYAPNVAVPAGDGPRSIALVDLDGDSDLDIALVTSDESGERLVRVLRNDLDGGQIAFAPSDEFLGGTNPLFVVADDFDGDESSDLITVNETTGARGTTNDDVTFITAASAICSGDCTGDSAVNFSDLVAMLGEFGTSGPNPGCDADSSGAVNFSDLVAALGLFGPCP